MARILSVSYYPALLETRELLLKSNGHAVTSAGHLAEALEHSKSSTRFDLLILGHSIPDSDKQTLIDVFHANCSAPVLALYRHGAAPVRGADLVIAPDHPSVLLDAVVALIPAKKTAAA